MKFAACFLASYILLQVPAYAKHFHPERYYQQQWCDSQGGKMEYVLPDLRRVDCLTKTHAVEVDFAAKAAEAIGQSLMYAHETGKQPGILLIIEQPKDLKYLDQIHPITDRLGIRLQIISPTPTPQ